jgi:protein-tyrosine phosphatase
LIPDEELVNYGVAELIPEFNAAGFSTYHLPIVDQKVASTAQVDALIRWMNTAIENGGKVLLHCVAGLGRSGMVAGAYLRRTGMDDDAAITAVRVARTARAIESGEQEEFIRFFN